MGAVARYWPGNVGGQGERMRTSIDQMEVDTQRPRVRASSDSDSIGALWPSEPRISWSANVATASAWPSGLPS